MDEQGNPIEDAEAIVFMENLSSPEYDQISQLTNAEGTPKFVESAIYHACIVVKKMAGSDSGNTDMYFFYMKNISERREMAALRHDP